MTSGHQMDQPGVADGTHWTRRQAFTAMIGAALSTTLWILTPVAHSSDGGWISNLAWTAAATMTLGSMGYVWQAIAGHRHAHRMLGMEAMLQRMYDRQEHLAEEIQKQHREIAEQLVKRQLELADQLVTRLEELVSSAVTAMSDTWEKHGTSLDRIRRRLGKLIAIQEEREAALKVRHGDFSAKAQQLDERMEALALLIESRMPPRQLPFRHRDGS